jgi:hypothetical protein
MTPTQIEHLRLIDAHLARLLDIAAKRTPGEWIVGWNMIGDGISKSICNAPMKNEQTTTLEWVSDKRFIASCAGNAEAGWRATRAMIEFALMVIEFHSTRPKEDPQRTELETVEEVAMRILAAFPLETLNPQKP